jgi:hypothetical protein
MAPRMDPPLFNLKEVPAEVLLDESGGISSYCIDINNKLCFGALIVLGSTLN